MIRPVPLAELVEDPNVYPRHAVDSQHVTALADALRAGETLPAIVAELCTHRIVDGVHRGRAFKQVLGPSAVIDVDERSYLNEAELIVDAIARNATHGRKFDRIDEVRATLMAERAGVQRVAIAAALHTTVERIERLEIRFADAPAPGPATIPGSTRLPLKRPLIHLQHRQLTAAQVLASLSAPGTSYLLVAGQLLEGIRADLLNMQDARLVAKLRELRAELLRVLP